MHTFIYWIISLNILILTDKKVNSEDFRNDTFLNHYKRLRNDLLLDYDIHTRPVKYHSNVTQVEIDIFVMYIYDVNEDKQTMVVDIAIGLRWNDHFLTWDPSKYNGITKINVLPSDIWKPDIFEVRSGDLNSALTESKIGAWLFSNGDIVWYIPTALTGRCKFKYNDYPTDTATCKIVLKTWTSPESVVDLIVPFDKPFMYFLQNDNPYWYIEDGGMRRKSYNLSYLHPSAIMTLSISRRQPTIQERLLRIISVTAALLTLCMFWVPADVRQKLTLGCVVLVILSIGLVTVESSIRVPKVSFLIANSIDITMYVVITAIIFEIIIIGLQNFEEYDPPEFVLKIFSRKLSKILLINNISLEEKHSDMVNLYENQEDVACSQKISVKNDWKTVGQIIDRMLFFIYLIILCISQRFSR